MSSRSPGAKRSPPVRVAPAVPPVTDQRHSCATLLYDQAVPLERIQDVLGHSSPTVTKSIYVEETRRVQQDAVDRLGFLFDA
ncbi:tyrosine-type recombinase/integrase [Micromonospora sp. NPDC005087]|uniref:tyrosine-type recombinase/integrase n=1 Tax=Micromonospora sp. NPDC005087 TaxID=3364225 RepID=UPI0036B5EA45